MQVAACPATRSHCLVQTVCIPTMQQCAATDCEPAAQSREDAGIIDDSAAEATAKALVKEALQRGTADNVTALVMLLEWS